eukprot:scaffold1087_cov198-Pinguiococcus_pyrenoidosus.AAC.22
MLRTWARATSCRGKRLSVNEEHPAVVPLDARQAHQPPAVRTPQGEGFLKAAQAEDGPKPGEVAAKSHHDPRPLRGDARQRGGQPAGVVGLLDAEDARDADGVPRRLLLRHERELRAPRLRRSEQEERL